MNLMVRVATTVVRLAAACAVSFLFFVGISMLHAMIDVGPKTDKTKSAAKQVLMEVVRKPPEEEEKKALPRVRQVTQSSDRDKTLEHQMTMKLVPDLTVDAGVGEGDAAAGVVQVEKSQDLQAEVFEEGETDERPIPLTTTPVAYPLEARERGIEGTLVVFFIIGHDGKVKSIDVQKSPSPIITREAKRTIATWRFKPGKKKGIPVNVRAKKEITFVLQK
ncbi:MAG: energy transducer TonB [Chitinispirillaceae bacterium]|nr:energy transducer TonB [Chitinispirillaceae bacterium]